MLTTSASVPPCTRLLAQDSDATLRGRLIRLAGMHRRTQLLDAVITALGDTDAKVRLEAIIAVDSFPADSGPSRKPSSILSLVSCSMTTKFPYETRP